MSIKRSSDTLMQHSVLMVCMKSSISSFQFPDPKDSRSQQTLVEITLPEAGSKLYQAQRSEGLARAEGACHCDGQRQQKPAQSWPAMLGR